jgi:hypothetical protein
LNLSLVTRLTKTTTKVQEKLIGVKRLSEQRFDAEGELPLTMPLLACDRTKGRVIYSHVDGFDWRGVGEIVGRRLAKL